MKKMKNRWLSWPGAKFRQMDEIFKYISLDNTEINHICEPYSGAAAFSLQFFDKDFYFSWAEKNEPLNRWWSFLLYEPETFIERMDYFRKKYINSSENRDVYNEMRDSYNSMIKSMPEHMDTSALLWVLIYHSTNNLARFNKKGEYNQTWGKGRKVPDPYVVFNEQVINDIYNSNAYVEMFNDDVDLFEHFLNADKISYKYNMFLYSTIFYLDPPYILRTEVYDKDWSLESEKTMFKYIHELDDLNTPWFMTNYLAVEKNGEKTEHPFIDDIKKSGWTIIQINRKIDARPTTSGDIAGEYIIVGKNKIILKDKSNNI